jgi:hypothetical protein
VSDEAPDPSRCPLCGVANQCGMAAGSNECWCFAATVSKDALERLPAVVRGKACVCARCAAAAEAATAGHGLGAKPDASS